MWTLTRLTCPHFPAKVPLDAALPDYTTTPMSLLSLFLSLFSFTVPSSTLKWEVEAEEKVRSGKI